MIRLLLIFFHNVRFKMTNVVCEIQKYRNNNLTGTYFEITHQIIPNLIQVCRCEFLNHFPERFLKMCLNLWGLLCTCWKTLDVQKKNFLKRFYKKRITKIMLLITLEDFATIWYNITFTAIVLQQHVHRYMVDLYFVLPVKNTFRITMVFFTKILSRSQNQSFYQKLIFKKDKDNKVWILPLLCASFF